MARRRKDEQEAEYESQEAEQAYTAESDGGSQENADEAPAELNDVGESYEGDDGEPASYRVEQAGFKMRGEVFARGDVVEMGKKVARHYQDCGIALVEVQPEAQPE